MKSKTAHSASTRSGDNDELPEDLSKLTIVRGKYYRRLLSGYTIRIRNRDGTITEQHVKPNETPVLLDPDVRAYFPTSESVNRALRALIGVIEQTPRAERPISKRRTKKAA